MSAIHMFGRDYLYRWKCRVPSIFVLAIAARLCQRGRMKPEHAIPCARDLYRGHLDDSGLEFGDPDFDWTIGGAVEIADEEMSHWEG